MNEKTITLTLTQTQCNTLASLIDVAIRAGGVQNAKLGMPIITMMEDELNNPKNSSSSPSDKITGKAIMKMKDLDGNEVNISGDNITIKGNVNPETVKPNPEC